MDNSKSEKLTAKMIWASIIGGIFVGFLNGFFGGGGGMIVVPLLVFLLSLEDKKAHATALLIILPISVASAVVYLINNDIEILKIVYTGIGFIVGGIIGALALKKINNKVLRIIFSIVMVAAGIRMLF